MTWRPYNETEADLKNEAAVVNQFMHVMGYETSVKLSENLYGIDFAFFNARKELVAMAEVKIRTNAYSNIILSAAKALKLYQWKIATHRPAWLVIHLPKQGILAHEITPIKNYSICIAGSDRGQNGDMEPCIMVPLSSFTSIAPPLELSE